MNFKKILFLSIIFLFSIQVVQASLQSDIYAYWNFDTGDAKDLTGNGHDGVVNGANWSNSVCELGGCYIFSGTTNNINFSSLNNFNNDVSIAGWINSTDLNKYYLYSNNAGPNTVISQYSEGGTNKNNLLVFDGTSWRGSNATTTTNQFHHYVWQFNATDNKIKVYVDGVISGDPISYDGSLDLTGLHIGAWNSAGNSIIFEGTADDLGIWNRSLNTSEIAFLASGGSPPLNSNYLIITAENKVTKETINNFNISFLNGSSFTTTTGNITLINWTNGNYTSTITSSGYVTNITSFEHINNTSLNFQLAKDNAVSFNFYDEQTEEKILNITYNFFSDSLAFSGNTTTGRINFTSLSAGTYTLEYSSNNYRKRNHFIYVPLATTSLFNTSLYLLNETEGNSYLPIILTQDDSPYSNYFQALRWYFNGVNTGEYRVIETGKVNAQGTATLFLEFNTASYKFRAYDLITNTVDGFYDTPTELFNQIETYRVVDGVSFFENFDNLGTLQATNITYHNTTTEFYEFSFAGVPENINSICLEVTKTFIVNVSVILECSTAENGALTYLFDVPRVNGTYSAVSYAVDTDGVKYSLAQRQDNFIVTSSFPTTQVYKNAGLLAGFFVTVTGAFVVVTQPVIAIFIMLAGIGILGTSVLGVIPFGAVFFITMLVIGFIVALVVKK